MWELDHREGWAQEIWYFSTVGWRRLSGVYWTARSSNQSINPEYSLEGQVPKLKLQYFGNLMQRADSLEKILMLGKIEGRRRRERQRMRWLDGNIDSMGISLSKLQEIVKGREAWYAVAHGVAKSQTWLSDWTKTKILFKDILCILGFFYAHFKWGWSVKLLHIFYTFRFFRFNSISSANNYFAFSFPSCTS